MHQPETITLRLPLIGRSQTAAVYEGDGVRVALGAHVTDDEVVLEVAIDDPTAAAPTAAPTLRLVPELDKVA